MTIRMTCSLDILTVNGTAVLEVLDILTDILRC